MSKEWVEEEAVNEFQSFLYTIGDDERKKSSAIRRLSFSRKHLKRIDGQILESRVILHVMSLKMGHNRIFLDFHIFVVHEGNKFFLIGQPIDETCQPLYVDLIFSSSLAKIRSHEFQHYKGYTRPNPLKDPMSIGQEESAQVGNTSLREQIQAATSCSRKRRNRNIFFLS